MTDLEKFIELYKSFGIECIVNEEDNGNKVVWLNDFYDGKDGFKTTKSEKFNGYSGFCSDIEFDANGMFIRQGFWE